MTQLTKVKKYFSSAAKDFDSLYSHDKVGGFMRFINLAFRKDIYERFVRTIKHVETYKPKSAIDVGCGSGRYVQALAKSGVFRIHAVDCAEAMIDLARANNRGIDDTTAEVQFTCEDFMASNFSERFDLVIAMGVFDYIADPVPVIRKMKELCNHSIVASFPSISFYRTPIRKIRYYFKQCPVYFYSEKQIRSACVEAGVPKAEIYKIRGAGMDYFVTIFCNQ